METIMIKQKFIDLLRVEPGKKIHLKDYDTGWAQTEEFKELGKDKLKERANEILEQNLEDLTQVQQLLAKPTITRALSPSSSPGYKTILRMEHCWQWGTASSTAGNTTQRPS